MMYTHDELYIQKNPTGETLTRACILLHGRGGTAKSIFGLANELNVEHMLIYAPQATNNSWYPQSFMAPEQQNQPALDSALNIIDKLVDRILSDGIPSEKIYFVGFSQGACLMLEYLARNAKKYAGAVAFTGGLIGDRLDLLRYSGDFSASGILITTGDPDPHVPLSRVKETAEVMEKLNAHVMLKVFPNRLHSISQQEITLANQLIFS